MESIKRSKITLGMEGHGTKAINLFFRISTGFMCLTFRLLSFTPPRRAYRSGVQHHAGDLDFFEGRIYVALECPAKILVLDPNLETVLDYKPLSGQKPGEPPPRRWRQPVVRR